MYSQILANFYVIYSWTYMDDNAEQTIFLKYALLSDVVKHIVLPRYPPVISHLIFLGMMGPLT